MLHDPEGKYIGNTKVQSNRTVSFSVFQFFDDPEALSDLESAKKRDRS